jgi:hypothetical protein
MTPVIRMTSCGLCGCLVPWWRACCYRCQVEMEKGWSE